MAHLATGHELFHAEFVGTLERNGRAHGDHGARFGAQGAPHGQLYGQDGVAVTVADAVRAPVKGAHVVDDGRGADEVAGGRRAAHEVGGAACIDGRFVLIALRDGGFLYLLVVVLRRSGIVWRLLMLLLRAIMVAMVRSCGTMAHMEGQAHVRHLARLLRLWLLRLLVLLVLLGRCWVRHLTACPQRRSTRCCRRRRVISLL